LVTSVAVEAVVGAWLLEVTFGRASLLHPKAADKTSPLIARRAVKRTAFTAPVLDLFTLMPQEWTNLQAEGT